MQKTDVYYLCIKDFHFPFESADKEIEEFHEKLADDVLENVKDLNPPFGYVS